MSSYYIISFCILEIEICSRFNKSSSKKFRELFFPSSFWVYFHSVTRIQAVYQEINFLGKSHIAGFKDSQQLMTISNFTETGKSNTCKKITEDPSAVSETPAVSQSQLDKYHMTRGDNKHTATISGRSKFTKIKGENTRKCS